MRTTGLWQEWSHDEAIAEIQHPDWLMIDNSGYNYWNMVSGELLKISYDQLGKFVHGKAYKLSPESSFNGYI